MTTKPLSEILKTTHPLVQAPMSWLTDAKLVAAVSNAGGLGILGPNAGQTEPVHGMEKHTQLMRQQIRQTRKLTAKSFGINIVLEDEPATHMWGMLKLAFEEQIKYYAVVGEPNQDVYRQIKSHGGIILARPLTPTVENARLAEQYGADIFVATGFDEGGDLPNNHWGTFTVVPAIVDVINIPVLAAGGITDNRGVKAAMALGADGVYLGTRFLATQESPAALDVKEKIINSTYKDLVEMSSDRRSINTVAAANYYDQYQNSRNTQGIDSEISKNGGARPGMLEGEHDKGVIFVNTGIDTIKDIPSVRDLVERLMA